MKTAGGGAGDVEIPGDGAWSGCEIPEDEGRGLEAGVGL